MKTIKLLTGYFLLATLMVSCYTEVIIEDDFIEESAFNTDQVLQSYDLWYVDINATRGNGEVPFLQRAFTVSFNRGVLYANNNIVGIGKTGGGLGIDVGTYGTLRGTVDIDHDIDGSWFLEVYAVNNNTIELYDASSDTSYYLKGYQTNRFDYDMVFYDNINYFIQEYDAWEKIYTSESGALNDFDNENYLQFLPSFFRSSIDAPNTSISNLQWDFEGNYEVYNVQGDNSLKTLTLDYDFFGDDYFELYVINDSTIELYHPDSGTTYEFRGRGYQEYLKSGKGVESKKRIKTSNPTMNVERKKAK
ncbi:nicotinic acid mononucleotide adenyltransferase [Maribacter hydrothermalis]|uniref:Nicotinic acid mononucleotide adenyltransferase n=1 Tax=Maribacter hydrothermalis TaxID=1836467 RepID=A0A1B7Z3Z4_9FLAO|nr:nicotinic acid mononucleotide adenyltransferase [Maribacter hydrothermalis]APQ17147.1 nicotinic acid mononucleotide adenyltransferase [Maribacter hydrothermalis]OBR37408.1 nicotinic acid mononucleotide adenyltransferase [Maribacter hydrothermalis]